MTAAPTVLVAGTSDAINLVKRVLEGQAEIACATSLNDALARLEHPPQKIICSVRFDESRMFDFLEALREAHPAARAKVICLRAAPWPLPPATRHGIEKALEALGITTFIDFQHVADEQGEPKALERLRAAILGG